MSMILDALTRAEHERQLEKQPDLKFVNHDKPNNADRNKIWVWVACALIANALIFFFVIQFFKNDKGQDQTLVDVNQQIVTQENTPIANQSIEQTQKPIVEPFVAQQPVSPQKEETYDRPLAMEANSTKIPEVDRPLIYEAKQPDNKTKNVKSLQTAKANQATKKGNVSFSTTELSADDAIPITNKPKLLIDQGTSSETILHAQSSSSAPSLRELPEGTRANLKQYEVNVHVFDDDPIRRFVLINMNKYKEGDRIINNGPLVEQITANGVVVDYGNGRALLPPK